MGNGYQNLRDAMIAALAFRTATMRLHNPADQDTHADSVRYVSSLEPDELEQDLDVLGISSRWPANVKVTTHEFRPGTLFAKKGETL